MSDSTPTLERVAAASRILAELDECRKNPRFSRFEESDIEIVARAALDASGNDERWQPIETAPMFKPILGFFGDTAGEDPSDMAVCRHVRGGWRDDRGGELDEPTHWQPLPEPPAAIARTQEQSDG